MQQTFSLDFVVNIRAKSGGCPAVVALESQVVIALLDTGVAATIV
jgi:hypothetical protein